MSNTLPKGTYIIMGSAPTHKVCIGRDINESKSLRPKKIMVVPDYVKAYEVCRPYEVCDAVADLTRPAVANREPPEWQVSSQVVWLSCGGHGRQTLCCRNADWERISRVDCHAHAFAWACRVHVRGSPFSLEDETYRWPQHSRCQYVYPLGITRSKTAHPGMSQRVDSDLHE